MCWRDQYIPRRDFNGNWPGVMAHRLRLEAEAREKRYDAMSIDDLQKIVSDYEGRRLNDTESDEYSSAHIVLGRKIELRTPF